MAVGTPFIMSHWPSVNACVSILTKSLFDVLLESWPFMLNYQSCSEGLDDELACSMAMQASAVPSSPPSPSRVKCVIM